MSQAPPRAQLCRNCGTPVSNRYCPYCGQSTALHPLGVREFVHEIVSHYVALEGRLWRTLALLAGHPGELTREFLAGRRQRYIAPLRLYLTASFLFFLASQLTGGTTTTRHEPPVRAAPGAAAGAPTDAADENEVEDLAHARAALRKSGAAEVPIVGDLLTSDGSACLAGRAGCSRLEHWIAPGLAQLQRDPEHAAERYFERFRHALSYAMFLLVPLFALLMALAYRGRRMVYGEHLVFALHLHAFWFFATLLFLYLPDGLGGLMPLWFLGYGFWAMHRVYGGRGWTTLLRGSAVTVVYGLLVALASAGLSLLLLATA
jgi:hypothetical protein